MSFVQASTIQLLAESISCPKVSSEAAKALAPHLDVRLREIIQEAAKFARHSKHATLTAEDIDIALRLRNIEPLYGFGGKDPARFVRATGHADMFYIQDLQIPVERVIEAPLPRVPMEVGVLPHWLAIDGVQPNTAENTQLERPRTKRRRLEVPSQKAEQRAKTLAGGAKAHAPAPEASSADAQNTPVIPPLRHPLSAELQLYLEKVKAVILAAKEAPESSLGGGALSGFGHADSQGDRGKEEFAGQKILDERAVLASLASDPGLHPLAPYLVQLISDQVKSNDKQLSLLQLVIKVAGSLLSNRHVHLELYLHQLMPALLTCLVAKRLGNASAQEDHWSLRDAAAVLIGRVCATWGPKYPNLQQRITKQLLNALTDASRPLTTHYGAVVGLAALGQRVVQLLVLPQVQPYLKLLEPALSADNPLDVQRAEALKVQGALMRACASCMYAAMNARLSKRFFSALQDISPKLPPQPQLDFGSPSKPSASAPEALAAKVPSKAATASKGASAAAATKPAASGGAEANGTAKPASTGGPEEEGEEAGGGANGALAKDKMLHKAAGGIDPGEADSVGGNALADAWQEDGNLGRHLAALHALFGDAVQPYVPFAPASAVLM